MSRGAPVKLSLLHQILPSAGICQALHVVAHDIQDNLGIDKLLEVAITVQSMLARNNGTNGWNLSGRRWKRSLCR